MNHSPELPEQNETQPDQEPTSTAALRLMALASTHGAELGADDKGLEAYSSDNPEELLETITDSGFLLHGTTRRIQGDFIPQKANDTQKESGNRTAIYMTNVAPIAMFKSLSGGVHMRGMTQHGVSSEVTDGKRVYTYLHFASSRPDKIADEGFVYVFDPSGLDVEEVNGEFLSYDRAKPLGIVRVRRDQFQYPIKVLPE